MRSELHRTRLAGLGLAAVIAVGGGGAAAVAATTHSGSGTPAVGVKQVAKLGSVLEAGPQHLTVYAFTADRRAISHCTAACLVNWPALTTTSSAKPKLSGGAKAGLIGTINRGRGVRQVTYAGHPLYYFIGDKSSGSAAGQDIDAFGGHWFAITAAGREITSTAGDDHGSASGTDGGGDDGSTTTATTATSTAASPSTTSTTPDDNGTDPGYGSGW